jgi:AAHS family 4-hydroxybenzoate transporter-like MFS transporter
MLTFSRRRTRLTKREQMPSVPDQRLATVDITEVIEAARFSGFALRAAILSLLLLILDGFDIQAVAFAAPALIKVWSIDRSVIGTALLAGLVGLAIGAVGFGRFADRIGRKPALVIGTLLFSVGGFLCSTAHDVHELVTYRFITGLGLGAPLPLATALIAEIAPRSWRNALVGLALIGIPLGGFVGAAVAEVLVPRFGWPSIFQVGALLPALLVPLLVVWLPESPKFLTRRPERFQQLAEMLNRLTRSRRFKGTEAFVVAESESRQSVATLVRQPYLLATLFLWLAFFTNVLVVYVFFGWLPIVLSTAGVPLALSVRGSLLFNLGGVVGALGAAALLHTLGSRRILVCLAVLAVIVTYFIGQNAIFAPGTAVLNTTPVFWCIAIAGVAINGVQISLYAVAAQTYPTVLRATGVGSAAAVARVGGIVSTVGGSALLKWGGSTATFFAVLACVLTLTLLAVINLRIQIPSRSGSRPL